MLDARQMMRGVCRFANESLQSDIALDCHNDLHAIWETAGFGFGAAPASSNASQAASAGPQPTPGFGAMFTAPAASAALSGMPPICAVHSLLAQSVSVSMLGSQ